MAYVCETLSSPALITGQQTCTKWIVYVPPSTSILPELTAADKDSLLLWMIGIFMVVFALKQLRKMFGA